MKGNETMKRKLAVVSILICLLLTLGASVLQASSPGSSAVVKSETMTSTLSKLREERTKLIEAQAEVVIQANEAKLRVENILKQSVEEKKALSSEQLEKLKKDLETIKSNQEILNTVLADIKAATSEQDELLPSKEYIEKLIQLYIDKTNQLIEVAKSLQSVAAEVK